MKRVPKWVAAFGVLALIGAACSDDGGTGGESSASAISSIGPTEGELNLIAWVGYTEDGTTEGYENYDWVTPFEDRRAARSASSTRTAPTRCTT